MSTGLQLAIDEILKVIDAKEAELLPLKVSANTLARQIPTDEPFPGIESGSSSTRGKLAKLSWRIDQFFNKPLAGCVSEILTTRRGAGLDGPATVDELFDDLKAGGFRFQGSSGNDENTKRAIKTALTKNTAQFAKIGEDKFGLKLWYGAPRGRPPKKTKAASGDLLSVEDVDQDASMDTGIDDLADILEPEDAAPTPPSEEEGDEALF
jgi:hypothetical protein